MKRKKYPLRYKSWVQKDVMGKKNIKQDQGGGGAAPKKVEVRKVKSKKVNFKRGR